MLSSQKARSVRVLLLEGTANGLAHFDLSNWDGLAYRIPRNSLLFYSQILESKLAGVYLLFGKDNYANNQIYIGQSENLSIRLKTHLSNEEIFWNEAFTFSRKAEGLSNTHIKYLEYSFYNHFYSNHHFQIINKQAPKKNAISKFDLVDQDVYFKNAIDLLEIAGYKEVSKPDEKIESSEDLFYLKGARGANATGRLHQNGFLVLKGSTVAQGFSDTHRQSNVNKYNDLVRLNIVNGNVFTENYLFDSPSMASTIILGRQSTGLGDWKSTKGISLGDYLKKLIL
jgi:hypothetical protein